VNPSASLLCHPIKCVLPIFNRGLVVLHRRLFTRVTQLSLRRGKVFFPNHIRPDRVPSRVPAHLSILHGDACNLAELVKQVSERPG